MKNILPAILLAALCFGCEDSPTPVEKPAEVTGVTIKPSTGDGKRSAIDRDFMTGELNAREANLLKVLQKACPLDKHMLYDCPEIEGLFDITIVAHDNAEDAWKSLQKAVKNRFGIAFREEYRDVEVFVLTCPDPSKKKLHELTDDSRGGLAFVGGIGWMFGMQRMGDLAFQLEQWLSCPVLDETNIKGEYDFVLRMDPKNPTSAIEGVKKLGLELTKAKRNRPVVVIIKKQ